MSNNFVEELINYRDELEKDQDSIFKIKVLDKLSDNFDKYSLDDFMNSKIGKSLKQISSVKEEGLSKKSLMLMEKMKKCQRKEKLSAETTVIDKDNTKKEKESLRKTSENSDKTKKKFSETEKKSYLENVKKATETLKTTDPMRNNVRKLIFNELLKQEECDFQQIGFIRNFTELIDESLHDQLYDLDDKGAKYLSRCKSIVFNLSVRLLFIFDQNRKDMNSEIGF